MSHKLIEIKTLRIQGQHGSSCPSKTEQRQTHSGNFKNLFLIYISDIAIIQRKSGDIETKPGPFQREVEQ